MATGIFAGDTDLTDLPTYADTQKTGGFWDEPAGDPPDTYSMVVAPAPAPGAGYVEVGRDTNDPAAIAVLYVAATVPPDQVARHLAGITLTLMPQKLMWRDVATLHPGATLETYQDGHGVHVADPTHWTGSRCIGWMLTDRINWETDPRPFGECLKRWHTLRHMTRDQAAEMLRVPRGTYDSWCSGRACEREGSLRWLMTLLDRAGIGR